MAFLDQALKLSVAQAVTVTAASTNLYDVTGAGSGNSPNMTFGVNALGVAQTAGFDIGTGDAAARPTLLLSVDTTFTAGGAATLTAQIQAAPDNGSNAPGTFTTIIETGALALAQLVAGKLFAIPIPGLAPGEALPRFYRVNYVVATGPMTAGAISASILLDAPTQINVQYPANFVSV